MDADYDHDLFIIQNNFQSLEPGEKKNNMYGSFQLRIDLFFNISGVESDKKLPQKVKSEKSIQFPVPLSDLDALIKTTKGQKYREIRSLTVGNPLEKKR